MKKLNKKTKKTLKNLVLTSTMLGTLVSVGNYAKELVTSTTNKSDITYISEHVNTENKTALKMQDHKTYDVVENNINLMPSLLTEEDKEVIEIIEEEQVMHEEEQKLIQHYADVYSLDYDIVYSIISEMTNEFTDEEYVNNNKIGQSTMKNKYVNCETKDTAMLIAVRNIYYNYSNYGYSFNEISTGVKHSSDLTYEQQIAKYADVVGVDKNLVYAITRLETGFDSNLFLNNHNPAGIIFNGKWASFPSFEAGFIEINLEILKYNLNGKHTIAEIGQSYAPTSDSRNSGWVSLVTSIYKQAEAMDASVFDYNKDEVVEEVLEETVEETIEKEVIESNDIEQTNPTIESQEDLETEVEYEQQSTVYNDEEKMEVETLSVNNEQTSILNEQLSMFNEEKSEETTENSTLMMIFNKANDFYNGLKNKYMLVNQEKEDKLVETNKVSTEESIIKNYSQIYGLDFDIIYQIISEETNNFESSEYLTNNIIGASTIKNVKIDCDSKELAIIIKIHDIFHNYENYGYSSDEIKVNNAKELNMSYESLIKKCADIVGVDYLMMYSISRAQSGFGSDLFLNQNNPAGLVHNKKYSSYNTLEAGYLDLALEVLHYNVDGRYNAFEIGEKFAPTSNPLNSGWASLVDRIYKRTEAQDQSVFEYEKEEYTFEELDEIIEEELIDNETEDLIEEELMNEIIEEEIIDKETEEIIEEEMTEDNTDVYQVYNETVVPELTDVTVDVEQESQVEFYRQKEEEKFINEFSAIYSLDSDVVYSILSELTDNFTSSEYLNENKIGNLTKESTYGNSATKEKALLIAIKSLYVSYPDYGYSYDEINTGIKHQSNLTYEQQIAKYSDIMGVDHILMYAIARAETGFSSSLFINNHNPGGIRYGSSWASFPSCEAGFAEHSLLILKYNLNGKYTPAQIGANYAPTSDPSNNHWVSLVTQIYNQASRYSYDVFDYSVNDEVLYDENVKVLQKTN